MSITIKELCSMSSAHKELLSQINAKSIVGKITGKTDPIDNLHWIAYSDVEQQIVKHDQMEQAEQKDARAEFREFLKRERVNSMLEFYNLKIAVTTLAAYKLIDDDLLDLFVLVDNEYIKELYK